MAPSHPTRMEDGGWKIAIFYPRSSIFDRLHLRGAGKPAVDDDNFAGDETVADNQAHHTFSDVVFSATALERRVLGAPRHQAVIIFRQRSLHPFAFDPSRRHRVDADLGPQGIR